MRSASRFRTLFLAAALAALAPTALPAAQPEPLAQRPFEVKISGNEVEVTFALIMSEVSTYPVTITAICCGMEEELYSGTLSEGFYRFRAPLTKLKGSGQMKVVLKTKVINRTDRGSETFIVYLKGEGAMK